MLQINGNIWYFHEWEKWVVIPTNGEVKKNGSAVMGAGLAKKLSNKYPNFSSTLGSLITDHGNRVFAFKENKVLTFPTKNHWKENSQIDLIEHSALQLLDLIDRHELSGPFYLPKVGCGLGNLDWDTQICPLLSSILDDRFVVINWKGN